MPHVAHLLVTVVALSSVAAARRLLLDESRVRPVLSSIMRCYNFSTLRVAVVQEGGEAQTLRLRLNDGNVEDISHDDEKLQIGSVSKGMFGTALPLIEQRLRRERNQPQLNILTTPLKQLLGDDFWFLDHGRTEQVTLQDLVSHTAGLDRHDLLWLLQGFRTLGDIAKHSSRLSAREQFRSSFLYNNLAFSVADAALQRLTNQTFAQYMRTDLWQPLGMGGAAAASEMNFGEEELSKSLELVEAAGGILLPLDDMVKYMQYHITNYNFSNVAQLPRYFHPVNAQLGTVNAGAMFSPLLLNDNVTNLPELEMHSYGYGWMKTHYRDSLSYFHNGAFFRHRAELDLFVKQNLAVFSYAKLGDGDSNAQSLYLSLLHKYVADTLLVNDSFITESNACSLLRQQQLPLAVARLRQLTEEDYGVCSGTFGNFGLGTVTVTKDANSGDLLARYGAATLRLIPLQRLAPAATYEFFVVLEYREISNAALLVARNSTHITVRGSEQLSLAAINSSGGAVNMTGLLEAGLVLQKGLDPSAWKRPQLCDSEPRAAAVPAAAAWLQLAAGAAVAMVTAASL